MSENSNQQALIDQLLRDRDAECQKSDASPMIRTNSNSTMNNLR